MATSSSADTQSDSPPRRDVAQPAWQSGPPRSPCATSKVGLPAIVAGVTTGPGRHELTLDAGLALHAHTPLTQPTPDPGAEVSLRIEPTMTALLDQRPPNPISGQVSTPPLRP